MRTDLEDQKASCLRLQAMGCAPVDGGQELDFLGRIETLEVDNKKLKDDLAVQKSSMKNRVKEYADEANDLSALLRHAEHSAHKYLQQLRLSESTCQSLRSKPAHTAAELHIEREANKQIHSAVSRVKLLFSPRSSRKHNRARRRVGN